MCIRDRHTPCWDQRTRAGGSGGSMMGQSLCCNQPPACVARGLKGSRGIGQSCITWPDLFAWSVRWSGKFIAAAVSFRWKWNRWQILKKTFFNLFRDQCVKVNEVVESRALYAQLPVQSTGWGCSSTVLRNPPFSSDWSAWNGPCTSGKDFFSLMKGSCISLEKDKQKQTKKLALTAFKGCHSLISCYDVWRVRVFVCM